ncbi:MAG: hypothetical protein ACWA5R_15145, partial [bacterium]
MFAKLRVMGVFALISTLTACGGGGGSGSGSNSSSGTTFTPADANAAYTGERNKALLTQQNGMKFVQALLGVDPSGQIVFRTQKNAQRITNSIQAQQVIAKLVNQANINSVGHVASHSERRQQRAVSDSGSCAEGGTLSYSGDLNENTLQGVITYRLNNCHSEGVTINGTMQVRINQYDFNYDQPKSADISFDDLTMTYAGQTYTSVGTQAYSHGAYPALSTIVSNVTETNPDGDQVYSKDLTYKTEEINYHRYSGKVFLSEEGYVDIGTPSLLYTPSQNIESGKLVLSGAAASKIKITPLAVDNYIYKAKADLDADGDGAYEFVSTQDEFFDWSNSDEFSLNKPPEVHIEHDVWMFMEGDYSIDDGIKIKDTLSLSYVANDPEGAGIKSFSWTLESYPNKNEAQIELGYYGDSWSFDPRVPGNYNISLKVEDVDGNIGIAYLNFTVLPNETPIFIARHGKNQLLSYQDHQVGVDGVIYLDNVRDPDGDSLEIKYNWEMVSKPRSSSAELMDHGWGHNRYMPFVIFDVEGGYDFRVTVTDDSEESSVFEFTLNILGREKLEVTNEWDI